MRHHRPFLPHPGCLRTSVLDMEHHRHAHVQHQPRLRLRHRATYGYRRKHRALRSLPPLPAGGRWPSPVMKPFCGGQLLDAAQSPFQASLCTRERSASPYALDKPGVMAVLPGFGNQREMREVLSFFETRLRRIARLLRCLGELGPGWRGGPLRLLQALPPLPRRARRRPHQQVLRPGKARRRSGAGSTTSRSSIPRRDCVGPAATATAAVPSMSTSPSACRKFSPISANRKNPSGLP